ncbi:hypothetical protein GGU45_001431 [Niabella hirudinis]
MSPSRKFIVVYNDKGLSSYLWMKSDSQWFMFVFFDGRDVHPVLKERFKYSETKYANLPDGLKKEMELDNFQDNIKAVYKI